MREQSAKAALRAIGLALGAEGAQLYLLQKGMVQCKFSGQLERNGSLMITIV